MRVDLRGLLRDGSNPGPGVDQNSAQTVAMPYGGTLVVVVTVVRQDGSAPDLAGYIATLAVKAVSNQWDRWPGFRKTVTLPSVGVAANVAVLPTIVPADTKFLQPGRYVYDVWLQSPSGEQNSVVDLSAFVLSPAAVPPPYF